MAEERWKRYVEDAFEYTPPPKSNSKPAGSSKPPKSDGDPLPYGVDDLDPNIQRDASSERVCCYVRGCKHWVLPPKRKKGTGEVCPEHGIYCHKTGTYRYAEPQRNIIARPDFFREHIVGHEFKYESHRLGQECSEDAVSWNVFVSLQEAGCLSRVAELMTGERHEAEPRLLLWGIEIGRDSAEAWDLLVQARERFESDLPVERPLTEPDIALHLPGEYLLLIEAKFTSKNGFYERHNPKKLVDLTLDQLITIYRDPELQILDCELAHKRDRIPYQLWRNMIFAEWMARKDSRSTKAYHVNLVRQGSEEQVCEEFLGVVRPAYHDRFEQVTWEQLYALADQHRPGLDRLCRYLEQKTARLRPAFQIKR